MKITGTKEEIFSLIESCYERRIQNQCCGCVMLGICIYDHPLKDEFEIEVEDDG